MFSTKQNHISVENMLKLTQIFFYVA